MNKSDLSSKLDALKALVRLIGGNETTAAILALGDAVLAMGEKEACDACGGEGCIDSGGFTPWGAGIDIACPKCAATPPPVTEATPHPWQREIDALRRGEKIECIELTALEPKWRRLLNDDLLLEPHKNWQFRIAPKPEAAPEAKAGREGWVNVYSDRLSSLFASEEYAKGVRDTYDGNTYERTSLFREVTPRTLAAEEALHWMESNESLLRDFFAPKTIIARAKSDGRKE